MNAESCRRRAALEKGKRGPGRPASHAMREKHRKLNLHDTRGPLGSPPRADPLRPRQQHPCRAACRAATIEPIPACNRRQLHRNIALRRRRRESHPDRRATPRGSTHPARPQTSGGGRRPGRREPCGVPPPADPGVRFLTHPVPHKTVSLKSVQPVAGRGCVAVGTAAGCPSSAPSSPGSCCCGETATFARCG